jgi:hypothetical protein
MMMVVIQLATMTLPDTYPAVQLHVRMVLYMVSNLAFVQHQSIAHPPVLALLLLPSHALFCKIGASLHPWLMLRSCAG